MTAPGTRSAVAPRPAELTQSQHLWDLLSLGSALLKFLKSADRASLHLKPGGYVYSAMSPVLAAMGGSLPDRPLDQTWRNLSRQDLDEREDESAWARYVDCVLPVLIEWVTGEATARLDEIPAEILEKIDPDLGGLAWESAFRKEAKAQLGGDCETFRDSGRAKVTLRLFQKMGLSPGEFDKLSAAGRAIFMRGAGMSGCELSQTELQAPSAKPIDHGGPQRSPAYPRPPEMKRNRRTPRGQAFIKLSSALIEHHQYSDRSCLNWEPIGVNELAKKACVSSNTASRFFRTKFGGDEGHVTYQVMCNRDTRRLVAVLALLDGESPVGLLNND